MRGLLPLALLLVLASCDALDATYEVEYRVLAPGPARAQYYAPTLGWEDHQITAEWSYRFIARSGDMLSVSVQNGPNAGALSVGIYVDGIRFKGSTASGPFSTATASGTAGK